MLKCLCFLHFKIKFGKFIYAILLIYIYICIYICSYMQFCLKRSSLLFNFIIYTFTYVIKYSLRELNYCLLFISMNSHFFLLFIKFFAFTEPQLPFHPLLPVSSPRFLPSLVLLEQQFLNLSILLCAFHIINTSPQVWRSL